MRLRPWTETKAKPCLPFLGLPMAAYSYFLCHKAGLGPFLFNLHHQADEVQKELESQLPHDRPFRFQDERSKLLGSGGAIWNAQSDLKTFSAFYIANGDEVLVPKDPKILLRLQETFIKNQSLACLLVTDHPDLLKTLKPVWVNDQNQVVAFGMDKPSQPCRPVHYTGYKIFDKNLFDFLPEGESNIFYEVLTQAMAQGQNVTVHHETQMHWFETGTPSGFWHAYQACLDFAFDAPKGSWERHYFDELFEFFDFSFEDYIFTKTPTSRVLRHKTTALPSSLECQGVVVLGKNINVGEKTSLKNCICLDGLSIPPETRWESQIFFQQHMLEKKDRP